MLAHSSEDRRIGFRVYDRYVQYVLFPPERVRTQLWRTMNLNRRRRAKLQTPNTSKYTWRSCSQKGIEMKCQFEFESRYCVYEGRCLLKCSRLYIFPVIRNHCAVLQGLTILQMKKGGLMIRSTYSYFRDTHLAAHEAVACGAWDDTRRTKSNTTEWNTVPNGRNGHGGCPMIGGGGWRVDLAAAAAPRHAL